MKEKAEHRGFKKGFIIIIIIIIFKYCVEMDNCGSSKNFGFICIYRLHGDIRTIGF